MNTTPDPIGESILGRVIKLGDHVDTDLIYPGRYVPIADPEEWPKFEKAPNFYS